MVNKTRKLLQSASTDNILVDPVNQFGYSMTVATVRDGREASEAFDRVLLREIMKFIDEDTKDVYEKREKQPGVLYLSPSSFGSCNLQVLYRLFGITETIPNHDIAHVGRMSRIYKTGDLTHYRLSAYFSLMGILRKREDSFDFELNDHIHFSGRLDDIVAIPESMSWDFKDGKVIRRHTGNCAHYVVDLKSAKDRSFNEMKKAGVPTDQYRKQLEIYMRVTGYPGILLMENKDTSELHEFLLKPSNRIWNTIKEEAEMWYLAWKDGTIPERGEEFNPDRFPCTFCGHRLFCWTNHDERQEKITQLHLERKQEHETKPKIRQKITKLSLGPKRKLRL